FAEVEHVVVMGVAAHAHCHQLDEHWSQTATCALGAPCECGCDRVGVSAVDGDRRHPVAEAFVGEDACGGVLAPRCRQCRLIVLNAEDRGEFSCSTGVDGLVPLA